MVYEHNTQKTVFDVFTVVKELRSKMLGQQPGYFKACSEKNLKNPVFKLTLFLF
jgi:hypothetical protein